MNVRGPPVKRAIADGALSPCSADEGRRARVTFTRSSRRCRAWPSHGLHLAVLRRESTG